MGGSSSKNLNDDQIVEVSGTVHLKDSQVLIICCCKDMDMTIKCENGEFQHIATGVNQRSVDEAVRKYVGNYEALDVNDNGPSSTCCCLLVCESAENYTWTAQIRYGNINKKLKHRKLLAAARIVGSVVGGAV